MCIRFVTHYLKFHNRTNYKKLYPWKDLISKCKLESYQIIRQAVVFNPFSCQMECLNPSFMIETVVRMVSVMLLHREWKIPLP